MFLIYFPVLLIFIFPPFSMLCIISEVLDIVNCRPPYFYEFNFINWESLRLENQRLEGIRLEDLRMEDLRLENLRLENLRLEKLIRENLILENLRLEKSILENFRFKEIWFERSQFEETRFEGGRLGSCLLEVLEMEDLWLRSLITESPLFESLGIKPFYAPRPSILDVPCIDLNAHLWDNNADFYIEHVEDVSSPPVEVQSNYRFYLYYTLTIALTAVSPIVFILLNDCYII